MIRQPVVLAFLTAKGGQGCTTVALSVAWELAGMDHQVVFVDADMSGTGNAAEMLLLSQDRDRRHIGNLPRLIGAPIAADDLAGQAVAHPRRANLAVVAGLGPRYGQSSGPSAERLLPCIGPAIGQLDADVVVVDLGSCLAHPSHTSPGAVGQIINGLGWEPFVVTHDAASIIPHAAAVLREARLARARAILVATRGGQVIAIASKALDTEAQVATFCTVAWDPRRAHLAGDTGVPLPGQRLVARMRIRERLAGGSAPATAGRPRRPAGLWRLPWSRRDAGTGATRSDS